MKRHLKLYFLTLWVTLILAMISPATVNPQRHVGAKTLVVSCETEDSVAFQISASRKVYTAEENIVIGYEVRNRGNKGVFLVERSSNELQIKESWVVEILEPVKTPNAHELYDYKLIRIRPGETHKGNVVIKASQLASNRDYDFGFVAVQVGFSYLFDISGLKDCKEAEYSLPCLADVYDRSKSVTIGNLVLERKVN